MKEAFYKTLAASAMLLRLAMPAYADPPAYLQVFSNVQIPSADHPNGILQSPLHKYFMKVTDDCDVIIVSGTPNNPGTRVYSSNTSGSGNGCKLTGQADSGLLLYDSTGKAVATLSGGSGRASSFWLFLQDDGNLIWFRGGVGDRTTPFWESMGKATPSATGPTGESAISESAVAILPSGGALISQTKLAYATMQSDCNFVIYNGTPDHPGTAIKATQTSGRGTGCQFVLQADNNVVVYDQNRKVIAGGGAGAHPPQSFWMEVSDDGNLDRYIGVYPDRSQPSFRDGFVLK